MKIHFEPGDDGVARIAAGDTEDVSALELIAKNARNLCPIPEAYVIAGFQPQLERLQRALDEAFERTQRAYAGASRALESLLALLDLDDAPLRPRDRVAGRNA